MSEYQYYEFLAIDRPLSARQIQQVRQFSTRADISATRFVNEYHWGDFRGDPDRFLREWFDVMVYFANWGTRRLMLSLVADAVDPGWREYEVETGLEMRKKAGDGKVLLDFWSEMEEPEYEEWDEGWMVSLAPIRAELLAGDLRPLLLGWLAGLNDVDAEELEEDAPSPPILAGLGELTAVQQTLCKFLRVDSDLLAVAADQSPPITSADAGFAKWIAALPQAEKDRALAAMASGSDPQAGAILLRRFRKTIQPDSLARIPIKQLLQKSQSVREAREAARRERAAQERARQLAQAQAAREKHLAALEAEQPRAWREIEQNIALRQGKAYDQAVTTLNDLRDVAVRRQALNEFTARLNTLREAHRAKSSLIQRLERAGLLKR
jgi:hypothetical protein